MVKDIRLDSDPLRWIEDIRGQGSKHSIQSKQEIINPKLRGSGMKAITVFLLLMFLPVAVGVCEWSFEYGGTVYSVFDDRLEVEKDGVLYVITEGGVVAPEGAENVICILVMFPLLFGLVGCIWVNGGYLDFGMCLLGYLGVVLISVCAGM